MKTKLILGALLSGSIMNLALAGDDKLSGDSDPIIGQYIGSHPDGTVPTQLIVNAGGTASFSDVNFIGSNQTWTGGFNNPSGTVATGGNITWKKIQNNKYKIAITLMAGITTPLGGNEAGLGAFPTNGFFRIAGTGTMNLSKSSKVLELLFSGCQYNVDDVHLKHPSNCVPNVKLKMFKVKGP